MSGTMVYYSKSFDFIKSNSDADCERVFGPMRSVLGPNGCTTPDVQTIAMTPPPEITITEIYNQIIDSTTWGKGVIGPVGLTETPTCGDGSWDRHLRQCNCPSDPGCHSVNCVCVFHISCNQGVFNETYQSCFCNSGWVSAPDSHSTLSFCDIKDVNTTNPSTAAPFFLVGRGTDPSPYVLFSIVMVFGFLLLFVACWNPTRKAVKKIFFRTLFFSRIIKKSTLVELLNEMTEDDEEEEEAADDISQYEVPPAWNLEISRQQNFIFEENIIGRSLFDSTIEGFINTGNNLLSSSDLPPLPIPPAGLEQSQDTRFHQSQSILKSNLPFGFSTESVLPTVSCQSLQV